MFSIQYIFSFLAIDPKCMNPLRAILILLITTVSFAATGQYREMEMEESIRYFQQSDSVYRVNKVKSRRAVESGGQGKQLALLKMDGEGRAISMELEPFVYGQTQTTYFSYGADGRIVSMKDQLIKGKRNEGFRELFGKVDYDKVYNSISDREVVTYNIEYAGDTIKTIVRINQHALVSRRSLFSENGQVRLSYRFDKDGKLFETTTTRYAISKGYAFLPEFIHAQTESTGTTKDVNYDYVTDDNGLIVERIAHTTITRTTKFIYNENGLLSRSEGYGANIVFEYEFFE
jgi:hypothetical protein